MQQLLPGASGKKLSAQSTLSLAARSFFIRNQGKREDALVKLADSLLEWGNCHLARKRPSAAKLCFNSSANARGRIALLLCSQNAFLSASKEWGKATEARQKAGMSFDYERGMAHLCRAKDCELMESYSTAAAEMHSAYIFLLRAKRLPDAFNAAKETSAFLFLCGQSEKAISLCKSAAAAATDLGDASAALKFYDIAGIYGSSNGQAAMAIDELRRMAFEKLALPVKSRISETGRHYG